MWPFKKKGATTPADLLALLVDGNKSKSGKNVNIDTALRVATVFACARVIANGISQVPLKVFKISGDSRTVADKHPLYDVLHTKTSKYCTSFRWRETAAIHMVLTGDSFSYIYRDLKKEVIGLVNIKPNDVTVVKSENIGEPLKYKIKGTDIEIPADYMLHLRGPSWDSLGGLDTVSLAREAIGLSIAAEENHATLFANGAKPSGLYTVEGNLTPEQHKKLKDFIEAEYNGKKSNSTMILDRGAKFIQMAMSGVDSQHIETRRFQIEDVCRFFNVMPIMVGSADKTATYASAEQMFLAHVVHTLSPWYTRIEQEFNIQLLTSQSRAAGYYVKFIAAGLMRGALKDTAEYLYRLVNIGIMTRNEARE